MTREKATKIVTDFLSDMNPDMWDGNGNKPESFDERAWQYPLTDSVNLEITFVNDEVDGWHHCCDLVDRKSTRLNSSHMPKSRMPSSA